MATMRRNSRSDLAFSEPFTDGRPSYTTPLTESTPTIMSATSYTSSSAASDTERTVDFSYMSCFLLNLEEDWDAFSTQTSTSASSSSESELSAGPTTPEAADVATDSHTFANEPPLSGFDMIPSSMICNALAAPSVEEPAGLYHLPLEQLAIPAQCIDPRTAGITQPPPPVPAPQTEITSEPAPEAVLTPEPQTESSPEFDLANNWDNLPPMSELDLSLPFEFAPDSEHQPSLLSPDDLAALDFGSVFAPELAAGPASGSEPELPPVESKKRKRGADAEADAEPTPGPTPKQQRGTKKARKANSAGTSGTGSKGKGKAPLPPPPPAKPEAPVTKRIAPKLTNEELYALLAMTQIWYAQAIEEGETPLPAGVLKALAIRPSRWGNNGRLLGPEAIKKLYFPSCCGNTSSDYTSNRHPSTAAGHYPRIREHYLPLIKFGLYHCDAKNANNPGCSMSQERRDSFKRNHDRETCQCPRRVENPDNFKYTIEHPDTDKTAHAHVVASRETCIQGTITILKPYATVIPNEVVASIMDDWDVVPDAVCEVLRKAGYICFSEANIKARDDALQAK